jgi:uracil-DNA glycosylase family 4
VQPSPEVHPDGDRSSSGEVDPRPYPLNLADCAHCPFAQHGLPVSPVLGEGPDDAYGILVGEGPGEEEAASGRPFVGTTGKTLDIEMIEAGLQRHRLFLVNATCCRPPKGKTEAMMQRAVKCCRPVLVEQLKRFGVDLPTFAMGKWAYLGLTGKDESVGDNRGFINKQFKLPRE